MAVHRLALVGGGLDRTGQLEHLGQRGQALLAVQDQFLWCS